MNAYKDSRSIRQEVNDVAPLDIKIQHVTVAEKILSTLAMVTRKNGSLQGKVR